jgi:hypothetical protein
MAGITITGHRGLPLAGWDDYSIWGVDSASGSLFAQLWRNDDDPDADPRAWIMPPRWPDTRDLTDLARMIAAATGVSDDTAARAIADSLGLTPAATTA